MNRLILGLVMVFGDMAGVDYPPIHAAGMEARLRIAIPERYRVGHEAHFAEVTAHFLKYLDDRGALPSWERPNMLAKYYVSTKGVEMAAR